MKNTHIKNLFQEVPADIRLEVYKEALELYKDTNSKIYSDNYYEYYSNGLCLVLPCVLWGLQSFLSAAPDGHCWSISNTGKAFPELDRESLMQLRQALNIGIIPAIEKRKELLQQWIKNLEESIQKEIS